MMECDLNAPISITCVKHIVYRALTYIRLPVYCGHHLELLFLRTVVPLFALV